jgi:peptidyl-prolyl cis-trans isomerase B (cyclophilin B)
LRSTLSLQILFLDLFHFSRFIFVFLSSMHASLCSPGVSASAATRSAHQLRVIAPRATTVARATTRRSIVDRHSTALNDASSSTSTSSLSTFSSAATALALSLALSLGAPCPALAASSVFFDVTVDGEPAGRLLVDLLGRGGAADPSPKGSSVLAPIGVARFAELAEDKDGVGYVRSKIDGIEKDRVIRSSGVASLAYRDSGGVRNGVAAPSRIPGGDTVEDLERELEAQQAAAASSPGSAPRHDRAGVVSLVVREPPGAPPPKTRLVAVNGRFVTVEEPRKGAPNGTAFVITMAPAPELDATNLVVGALKEGQALVARLSELPVASDRSESAFFKVAKATGDRRADAAAKFFYRPFQKVVIVNSGKL